MKAVISKEKKYIVDETKDFHSEFGVISVEMLKGSSFQLKGQEFHVVDASFIDKYEKIKRRAQIITQKDVGFIITNTGIGGATRVFEAGSGSGALCCFLANLCKQVISYDTREEHQEIARLNAEQLGLKNITFKIGDVRETIEEKNIDVAILDMPDPWAALQTVRSCLKIGGFLVVYSPTIPQVMDTVEAAGLQSSGYIFVKSSESIERGWEMDGRKVRPMSSFINHTGFISIFRRV